MTDEIYALAAVLSPENQPKEPILRALCRAAETELKESLRPEVTPEDCKESFVPAAALLAVSHYAAATGAAGADVKSFSVGGFSATAEDGGAAGKTLRAQALLLMKPFVKSGFSFLGVS